jgi:hypothetical protein
MARGRSLRGRLVAVLDERRNRSTVSTAQAVRASVLAMLVIVPLACLAPAVRADSARMLEAPVARAVTAPDVPVSDAPATMRVWAAERPTAPRPTIRVQGAQADPDLTVRVLRQAAARDLGDREMANLLEVAVNAGAVSSVATRDAFMAAARTIGGDRDRARALDAFLETGPDEAGVIAAVDAAAGMGSDREVARILTKAIGVRPLTQELRDTFVRVMEGIGSDRERRRVAEALLSAGG